jgi:MoaA/NifB/PqqE/SkfB family radical SAM enzyme
MHAEKYEIEKFFALREASSTPHIENTALNELEYRLQAEYLLSYPQYISVNTSSVCNARCAFCYYSERIKPAPMLTARDFRAMPWLKNCSTVDLFGGIGEPFLNPHFSEIVDVLKMGNAGQTLCVTSNGQRLTRELADSLAGRLTSLNISINAATKESYTLLMQECDWDKLLSNLRYFQEINLKKECTTRLTFSYVVTTYNVEELLAIIPTMKELSVDSIGLSHFATNGIWPERRTKRLSRRHSLYTNQKLYDEYIEKYIPEFKKNGVKIGYPPKFSAECAISYGARSLGGGMEQALCASPWSSCYISPLALNEADRSAQKNRRFVLPCCSLGADIASFVPFLLENFHEEVWNSEAFRLIRRKANDTKDMLTACKFCRNTDKSAPESAIPVLDNFCNATEDIFARLNTPLPDSMRKQMQYIQAEKTRLMADPDSL